MIVNIKYKYHPNKMSCFSLSGIENKLLKQQYYDDIKCFRVLNHYQRKHVIMCRCGRFPHVLGSTSPGVKVFKYIGHPIVYFVWNMKMHIIRH